VQVRQDGLQLVAQQAQPLGLGRDVLGHARLRAAPARWLMAARASEIARRGRAGTRQVRDAGGHAGDGPARGERAQQPHPWQHLALGRRGQRERVVRALRDRRRQARRCLLFACAWWLSRRRGGGRSARPAGRSGGAAGARGGLDWAPAVRGRPGRPVQPQAAPQQRQPALPRLLRRRGGRVCAAARRASARACTLLRLRHSRRGAPASAGSASAAEAAPPSSLVSDASVVAAAPAAGSSGAVGVRVRARRRTQPPHEAANVGSAGRASQAEPPLEDLVPAAAARAG